MDKATADRLARLMKPAIDAVLKNHGFDCEIAALTMCGLDVLSSKLTIKPIGKDLQLQAFMTYAHLYGCTASDYKREVRSGGHVFQIIGFNPKRTRYPVDAIRGSDSRPYSLSRDCLDQLKEAPAKGVAEK